mmetsp:Transcript_2481/g.5899  ORF Transcript_2481/g.5899 Transcript_2481/m.5899 type:complete len:320 (-) Transcript_2481:2635-3594(-)
MAETHGRNPLLHPLLQDRVLGVHRVMLLFVPDGVADLAPPGLEVPEDLQERPAGVRLGASRAVDVPRLPARVDRDVREGEEDVLLAASRVCQGGMAEAGLQASDSARDNAAEAVDVEDLAKHVLDFGLEGVADLIAAEVEHRDRRLPGEAVVAEHDLDAGEVVVHPHRGREVLLHAALPEGKVALLRALQLRQRRDVEARPVDRIPAAHRELLRQLRLCLGAAVHDLRSGFVTAIRAAALESLPHLLILGVGEQELPPVGLALGHEAGIRIVHDGVRGEGHGRRERAGSHEGPDHPRRQLHDGVEVEVLADAVDHGVAL